MNKYVLFIMIILLPGLNLSALGLNDSHDTGGKGNLRNFESVSINIPAQTELIKGSSSSVDIQMSEKTARNIDVYTDRGTLVIKSKGGSWIRKSDQIKIKITMPYWETLRVSSSGTLYSEDKWTLDHALIRNSGSCDIDMRELEAEKLEYRSSGSGDISISELYTSHETEIVSTGSGNSRIGIVSCESLSVEITGSGDFSGGMKTEAFIAKTTGSGDILAAGRCERADLHSTGSGEVLAQELSAGEAYVRTSGSGDITLKDGARLKEIRMTGSGTFRSL